MGFVGSADAHETMDGSFEFSATSIGVNWRGAPGWGRVYTARVFALLEKIAFRWRKQNKVFGTANNRVDVLIRILSQVIIHLNPGVEYAPSALTAMNTCRTLMIPYP
jgi:hypothetical protein